jgi:hypothetical protein
MKPSKIMINDDELHAILFNNIEEIYKLHSNFLIKLE